SGGRPIRAAQSGQDADLCGGEAVTSASSPAKAGDPVNTKLDSGTAHPKQLPPAITGCPAFAGHDDMNVHYIYCHPLPESFHAAIRAQALAGLKDAGHAVDLCDLYAEKFDPVISEQERRDYHDLSKNQSGVTGYVRRLREADALICQFPVWSFGPPAMLKGWMDRLLMPGVAFDLSNPNTAVPMLQNLKRIAGITTYGR